MGLEAACRCRHDGRESEGKARLEEDALYFRGDFRLKIPFRDIRAARARKGELTVRFGDGTAALALGSAAEAWALKIRYPRSRIDKLGVKPGQRVSVLGVEDEDFLREARERAGALTMGRAAKGSDLVFFGVTEKARLARLRSLQDSITRSGAIWAIWPKGQKGLNEDHVRAAALKTDLVDVKVVSFSETLSALKLMIRREKR